MVWFPLCVCSGTSVSAEIDEAELEGGTKIQPVSVLFPEGSQVPTPPQSEVLLNIPPDILATMSRCDGDLVWNGYSEIFQL